MQNIFENVEKKLLEAINSPTSQSGKQFCPLTAYAFKTSIMVYSGIQYLIGSLALVKSLWRFVLQDNYRDQCCSI